MEQNGCAFHCDYPPESPVLDPGCQFKDEAAFFDCGGKRYCRFHLPMADDDGRPTEKSSWLETGAEGPELAAFNKTLEAHIEAASEAERYVNFSGVVFPGDIDFENRAFPDVFWYLARFPGRAIFHKVKFQSNTIFSNAEFKGDVVFSNAEFKGFASFRNAEFKGDAVFADAQFEDYTYFTDAEFEDGAYFNDAEFKGRANFTDAEFKGFASFRNAEFKGDADFTNGKFSAGTNFQGSFFKHPPLFHNAPLHQDTRFNPGDRIAQQFPNIADDIAEQAYRTLKRHMIANQAHREEQFFFRLEMKARAKHERWWRRLLYSAYDFFSDYGHSIARPLGWWIVLLSGMIVVQAAASSKVAKTADFFALTVSDWIAAGMVAASNALPIGGFARHGLAEAVRVLYAQGIPAWLPILGTLHTVLSGVLFFLAVLALRNLFRMK